MKTYRKELAFNIPTRIDFINIMDETQTAIDESGVQEGLALVNPMRFIRFYKSALNFA